MKEDIQKQIDQLPVFVLRDVAILCNNEWQVQRHFKAVTEADNAIAIEVVSSQYKLVQFRDLFHTAIQNLPDDIEGKIWYYFGIGEMDVFPVGEQVGLTIKNSVDRRQAVRIDLAVRVNTHVLTLPSKVIPSFRKMHRGMVNIEAKNFLEVVGELRDAWNTIVTKMNTTKLTEEIVTELLKLKLNKTLKDVILNSTSAPNWQELTLWELFLKLIDTVNRRHYKTELHKRWKLRQLGNVILNYCMLLQLQS